MSGSTLMDRTDGYINTTGCDTQNNNTHYGKVVIQDYVDKVLAQLTFLWIILPEVYTRMLLVDYIDRCGYFICCFVVGIYKCAVKLCIP